MDVLQEAKEGDGEVEALGVCVQAEEAESASVFRQRLAFQDRVRVRGYCVGWHALLLLSLLRLPFLRISMCLRDSVSLLVSCLLCFLSRGVLYVPGGFERWKDWGCASALGLPSLVSKPPVC